MRYILFRKKLVIVIILLFLGTCITSSTVATQPAPNEYRELMVFHVFVFGTIKDPYCTIPDPRVSGWEYNFQVINITIIGLFWEDLGDLTFGIYHLNDSWTGKYLIYYGINSIRIFLNPPETAFICGTLNHGDLWGYLN